MAFRRNKGDAALARPPRARGIAHRLVAGRAPQCLGRILLLTLLAIAIVAHVPGLASVAVSVALVSTVLAAIWTTGLTGYAFVVAAQLVQLSPAASRIQLVATAVAVAFGVGT